MNTASAQFEDILLLERKLKSSQAPAALLERANFQLERLSRMASAQGYLAEYDMVSRYLDWICSLPWINKSEEMLSLENAKKVMDENHYGLQNIKERILEYISVAQLKKSNTVQEGLNINRMSEIGNLRQKVNLKAPSILLLGLVGTGKTTMAYSIAQALGRKFGRIPMGGMGDVLQLRGKAKTYPDAEPGLILKVLRRAGAKNPVILLDEIDRVTEEARADIMGVLVELLDPEQNSSFLDHFIDYPFDLSEVLFIATANNTTNIVTAVLDRLEVVEMPNYTDEQKIIIGKNYLFPRALAASGISKNELVIDEGVWNSIVRPLGFDAGMRTLDRTINAICRKVAKLKVEGKIQSVVVTNDNLKEFIPKW